MPYDWFHSHLPLLHFFASFTNFFGLGRRLSGGDFATDVEWGVTSAFDPEFTGVIVVGFGSCDGSWF
jgi:hypothetical protein